MESFGAFTGYFSCPCCSWGWVMTGYWEREERDEVFVFFFVSIVDEGIGCREGWDTTARVLPMNVIHRRWFPMSE
jgi:hypothetical protein